jgi:hypothetical protein
MQSNQTTHSLNILEAFPEDEGVYKCTVKNPAGQVSTSAFLKIERITLFFFYFPKIIFSII